MSAEFVIPDWMAPADGPSAPPPQTPIDDHRVEDLVNRFIAAKQDALFEAPDAYYRSEGRDAVDAAPAILDRLNALRVGTLDQADDDRLRTILGQRLDLQRRRRQRRPKARAGSAARPNLDLIQAAPSIRSPMPRRAASSPNSRRRRIRTVPPLRAGKQDRLPRNPRRAATSIEPQKRRRAPSKSRRGSPPIARSANGWQRRSPDSRCRRSWQKD